MIELHENEIIVDNFAGGGGASLGIEMALGRSPDIAINHDPQAVAMHEANHPNTRHYVEDVWAVDPVKACAGRPVGLAWFSPDCKHFSKAKGGKPVSKKIRGLAWIVVKWAKLVRPRVICLENVEEFQDWGPLDKRNMPNKLRKGKTFQHWKASLENLGYKVEHRELVAADYGAPTTRNRLFLVARCDGLPIVWPDKSHDQRGRFDLPKWRAAAECIEWGIPCYSIFLTKEEARPFGVKRPLADNTMNRIARGLKKFVIDNPNPFIVPVTHAGDSRVNSIEEPLRTITAAKRGEHALVSPVLVRTAHGEQDKNGKKRGKGEHDAAEPLPTQTASPDYAVATAYLAGVGGRKGQSPETSVESPYHTVTAKNDTVLVAPTLATVGYGEREGQAPRAPGLDKPLGTVVAGAPKHALVAAFLAKHFGDQGQRPGSGMDEPVATVTACDHNALVASSVVKLKGTCQHGQQMDLPLGTVQSQGLHYAESRAFLTKYYCGRERDQEASLDSPMHTLTAKHRMGLVVVRGELFQIVDIGMRMLVPRELYRAQGFPDSYKIDIEYKGKPLPKDAQVRMCGNSVSPYPCAALVRAQFMQAPQEKAAA